MNPEPLKGKRFTIMKIEYYLVIDNKYALIVYKYNGKKGKVLAKKKADFLNNLSI